MKNFKIFQILFSILIPLVFFQNCSNNTKSLSVKTVNDGRIQQPNENKVSVQRLHFAIVNGTPEYRGLETTESFQLENQLSVPDSERDRFYGYSLLDSDQLPMHQGLLKRFDVYSNHNLEDYLIKNFFGHFYIEIPILSLNLLTEIAITDLASNDVVQSFKIEDPEKIYVPEVVPEDGWDENFEVFKISGDQPSETAFDIVILADGFDKSEIAMNDKEALLASPFGQKLQEIVLPVFVQSPFDTVQDIINIWVVATVSQDSGVDEPGQNVFKNTVYGSSFGGYCRNRLLVVREQERALAIASKVPFDQAIVMVNSETYGGSGGEIASFSLNALAPGLIRHELSHAIARFADEYSYFSDDDPGENCDDPRIKQLVAKKGKLTGSNSFFADEASLAPNLSLFSQRDQVRWSANLVELSPVVFFDFPNKQLVFSNANAKFEGEYTLQSNQESLHILLGQSQKNNSIAETITSISIDGQDLPFTIEKPGAYNFLRLELPQTAVQNSTILVGIDINQPLTGTEATNAATDRHFMTLSSGTFLGDINEVGIFQGAAPDLKRTFRSSYVSEMSILGVGYNAIQKQSLSNIIGVFGIEPLP